MAVDKGPKKNLFEIKCHNNAKLQIQLKNPVLKNNLVILTRF